MFSRQITGEPVMVLLCKLKSPALYRSITDGVEGCAAEMESVFSDLCENFNPLAYEIVKKKRSKEESKNNFGSD